MLNMDGDLPRHLLMGKIVLETKTVPTTDIFSYVYEGRPLIPHEWLAGVIFFLFYSKLGLDGIVLLSALLLSITFTLVYDYALLRCGARFPSLILVVWGAATSSLHWLVRPHLFTMLFLAIFLILADRLIRDEFKQVWLFPVLMVIWANLHAEFVAGLLVLAAYCAGWIFDIFLKRTNINFVLGKRLGVATILSILATLVNPAGFHTWETVFGYVNNRYLMLRIMETRPPDFSQPQFLILLALLIFCIVLVLLRIRKLGTGTLIALAGFSAMSIFSARNVHLYGVVAPVLLACALTGSAEIPALKTLEKIFAVVERSVRGFLWPGVTVFLLSGLLLGGQLGMVNEFSAKTFPVRALNWLEMNPQHGRMFNAFDWGGYILFNMWPTQLAFIDSQTDVHGDITREYERAISLEEGWQDVFTKYDIRWVIIPKKWHLVGALAFQGWRDVYHDELAVILVRP